MSSGKLLIVDDEKIAVKNLEHVLKKEGYEVTATQSGANALSHLDKQQFDVVLTDLRMEKVDGPRSARTLAYIGTTVNTLRTKIETPPKGDSSSAKITKVAAYRAAEVTASLRTLLRNWYQFYNGYDPLFSWWTGAPYRSADSALINYQRVLRE